MKTKQILFGIASVSFCAGVLSYSSLADASEDPCEVPLDQRSSVFACHELGSQQDGSGPTDQPIHPVTAAHLDVWAAKSNSDGKTFALCMNGKISAEQIDGGVVYRNAAIPHWPASTVYPPYVLLNEDSGVVRVSIDGTINGNRTHDEDAVLDMNQKTFSYTAWEHGRPWVRVNLRCN